MGEDVYKLLIFRMVARRRIIMWTAVATFICVCAVPVQLCELLDVCGMERVASRVEHTNKKDAMRWNIFGANEVFREHWTHGKASW